MERKTRFELATLALARRCSTTEPLPHIWWREMDSNHRKLSWRIYSPFPLATRESLHKYFLNGAGEENRTPNLLITNQLLYRWATPAYYNVSKSHAVNSICTLQSVIVFYERIEYWLYYRNIKLSIVFLKFILLFSLFHYLCDHIIYVFTYACREARHLKLFIYCSIIR